MKPENILLYLRNEGKYILLRTYSRRAGGHGRFFINNDKLDEWLNNSSETFWDSDCGNILRIDYDACHRGYRIRIWWIHDKYDGTIDGFQQDFFVGHLAFLNAIDCDEWQKILCKPDGQYAPPKFIWTESARKNLRAIAKIQSLRKAWRKAWGHGVLQWHDTTFTVFADSPFNVRDFYFVTNDGISGGLIAHNTTTAYGTPKWEYGTHT